MRHDMTKVVTERPRSGSRSLSKKTGRKLHPDEFFLDDHGPIRLPISRVRQYGWHCKEFSDLLGPLRGFLRKQVGRSWNSVYSELSRYLDKRSLTGSHIWDHIGWEVNRNCTVGSDGKVYDPNFKSPAREAEGFYVHPKTQILYYREGKSFRREEWYQEALVYDALLKRLKPYGYTHDDVSDNWRNFRIIDDLTIWERRNGLWFAHEFAHYNPEEILSVRFIGECVEEVYRRDRPDLPTKYRVKTRQLSRKEFRNYV